MKCPACAYPLIVVERDEIELDYCLTCKGFWFDQTELELLASTFGPTKAVPDLMTLPPLELTEIDRACPRCNTLMDKVNLSADQSPVHGDRCPEGHGLWFDPGEMGVILSQLSQQQDTVLHPVMQFLGEALSL